jgi:DNA invertase Pin-like site-specific DNA recombinase
MTEATIAIYARAYGPPADASLVVQTDACRRLTVRLGCNESAYFLERNASGFGDAIDRLLTAVETGSLDAVIIASRDRLHSDPGKVDLIVTAMADAGVAMHFVAEEGGFVTDPI